MRRKIASTRALQFGAHLTKANTIGTEMETSANNFVFVVVRVSDVCTVEFSFFFFIEAIHVFSERYKPVPIWGKR